MRARTLLILLALTPFAAASSTSELGCDESLSFPRSIGVGAGPVHIGLPLTAWDMDYSCTVPNGSFERCTGCVPGGQGVPDGWAVPDEAAGVGTGWEYGSWSGMMSARIVCAEAQPRALVSAPVPLPEEGGVFFGAASRAAYHTKVGVLGHEVDLAPVPPAPRLVRGMEILDAEGAVVGMTYSHQFPDDDWTYGASSIVPYGGARAARMTLGCDGPGTVLIDHAQIGRGSDVGS